MTRLLELLISTAIVAVLFLGVGALLPSERTLTESVETNRRLSIVFDTLNSVKRFKDWNPVVLRDPSIDLEISGPEAGVGARIDYRSSKDAIGKGSWEIVESEEDVSITYKLDNPQRGENKRMVFTLKPTGRNNRNVEISQRYDVEYGWNLLGRYAGMYVSRHVGDDVKLGLNKLGSMLAAVPNVDYRAAGTRLRDLGFVDLPEQNLLVVSAGAVLRDNVILQDSMKANTEWINRTMAANNLEAAGPMRIVTSEMGRETYTFDLALPVRIKPPAPSKKGRKGRRDAEQESAAAEAETAAVDDGELPELELPGKDNPVKYIRTEPVRAVMGRYTGFMAELENVRTAIRAWSMTQGHDVTGRPYDIYEKGIETSFTEDGEFEVYWALRN